MAFSIAANENTDINNSTLLAIFICDVSRGQRTFEQEVLQGKTSGNSFVMRKVSNHWMSYALFKVISVTTDWALTKGKADTGLFKQQISRWQYFVETLNI